MWNARFTDSVMREVNPLNAAVGKVVKRFRSRDLVMLNIV